MKSLNAGLCCSKKLVDANLQLYANRTGKEISERQYNGLALESLTIEATK
jgi:hypothetical protein